MLAMLATCAATIASAQSVEIFSPQGTVKGVRQASARFAVPMVAFGDPRELDPFEIDCSGQGTRALGRHAQLGLRFRSGFAGRRALQLHCEVRAHRGRRQHHCPGQRFDFSTGGPSILRSLPYEGTKVDENQIFVLGLDAPATPTSIAASAYCVAAGIHERIGVAARHRR
jgi:hypothetical protein